MCKLLHPLNLTLNHNLNPFPVTGGIKSKIKSKIKTGRATEVNHA